MAEVYGDKVDTKKEDHNNVLHRGGKTMTHELGHIFGIKHCTMYECGMNGSNSFEESLVRPIEFCPECYQKIHLCLQFDHQARFSALTEACNKFEGNFLPYSKEYTAKNE